MAAAKETILSRGPQWLARIGPSKGLGEDGVEVLDEVDQPAFERFKRFEGRPPERTAGQDAEPDLDLVQPGRVPRGVDEANPVVRGFEEALAGLHALENGSDRAMPVRKEGERDESLKFGSAVQRVRIPPDQSLASRSVASLAVGAATRRLKRRQARC